MTVKFCPCCIFLHQILAPVECQAEIPAPPPESDSDFNQNVCSLLYYLDFERSRHFFGTTVVLDLLQRVSFIFSTGARLALGFGAKKSKTKLRLMKFLSSLYLHLKILLSRI